MKLTREQVKETLTSAWGKYVYVVPHRMFDDHTVFVATGREDHWMLLRVDEHHLAAVVGLDHVVGPAMFEAPESIWPDPRARAWEDAIYDVSIPLIRTFLEQGNDAAIRRLHHAITLAVERGWPNPGDEEGPWEFASSQMPEVRWTVDDKCECPDADYNLLLGGWCSHKIARELCEQAIRLLKDEGPNRTRYEGRGYYWDG